eukprot:365661-Chlamydomonas_euryale.AAC.34
MRLKQERRMHATQVKSAEGAGNVSAGSPVQGRQAAVAAASAGPVQDYMHGLDAYTAVKRPCSLPCCSAAGTLMLPRVVASHTGFATAGTRGWLEAMRQHTATCVDAAARQKKTVDWPHAVAAAYMQQLTTSPGPCYRHCTPTCDIGRLCLPGDLLPGLHLHDSAGAPARVSEARHAPG